jgi:hypothetical protein
LLSSKSSGYINWCYFPSVEESLTFSVCSKPLASKSTGLSINIWNKETQTVLLAAATTREDDIDEDPFMMSAAHLIKTKHLEAFNQATRQVFYHIYEDYLTHSGIHFTPEHMLHPMPLSTIRGETKTNKGSKQAMISTTATSTL